VELALTTSKHLKTLTETFLSRDQSTWPVEGLQQIHTAGSEAARRAILKTPSGLQLMTHVPGPAARGATQPRFTTLRAEVTESSPGGLRPAEQFLYFN